MSRSGGVNIVADGHAGGYWIMMCSRKSLLATFMISSALIFILYNWKDTVHLEQVPNFAEEPRSKSQKPNHQATFDERAMDLNVSESLWYKIRILRDALLEAHSHPLALATEPTCKGSRLQGEVEDLLCMDKPKYLADVKNPCWWDQTKTLRCLPYFHLLGVHKSGSTDLWERITSHPDVIKVNSLNHKEIRFWGKARFDLRGNGRRGLLTFRDYTNFFSTLTSLVKRSLKTGGTQHRTLITGDGTPSDMTELRGWSQFPQNRGRTLPHVLTPNLMKYIYPNTTKFIVILRNPIDRIYSGYFEMPRYRGTSSQKFHLSVLKSIDVMASCVQNRGLRECFYDLKYFYSLPMEIECIDYSLYIAEWLKVFPRDRFLFIKTEDYKEDIAGTVRACWEFLGLEPLEGNEVKEIANKSHRNVGKKKPLRGPMWRSTKKILEEIIRPSAHFLPELLGDSRFTWDFDTVPVVNF